MTDHEATVTEAMIVAGGAGTRLAPLTDATPKPLLPFCGVPLLTGMIQRLTAVGVRKVLLVVGDNVSPFVRFAAAARFGDVEIELVNEPEPLDTAGGVRSVLERVSGTFLVLNGDILTDIDLSEAIRAHHRADAGATLVLTRVEDTSSFGVCVRDGTRITSFVEKPEPGSLPGQDTINAGTYVLEPEVLTRFPTGRLSFEREVFPRLVADGVHVEGVVAEGHWADLGTPERFLAGHLDALGGALSWPTLETFPADVDGIRRADDAIVADDAELIGPVLLAPGTHVGSQARVGPGVCLGAGTVVEPHATVRQTVTFSGARIGSAAEVTGAVAGVGADIGDGAVIDGEAHTGVVVLGDRAVVASGAKVPAGRRVPTATP